MDSVVHDAAVINNVLDQLNNLHDAETKAEGSALGMDSAAVISNALDQLKEVAVKLQTRPEQNFGDVLNSLHNFFSK